MLPQLRKIQTLIAVQLCPHAVACFSRRHRHACPHPCQTVAQHLADAPIAGHQTAGAVQRPHRFPHGNFQRPFRRRHGILNGKFLLGGVIPAIHVLPQRAGCLQPMDHPAKDALALHPHCQKIRQRQRLFGVWRVQTDAIERDRQGKENDRAARAKLFKGNRRAARVCLRLFQTKGIYRMAVANQPLRQIQLAPVAAKDSKASAFHHCKALHRLSDLPHSMEKFFIL